MSRLKIKSPVNSLASAIAQIDAGAEELYLGLDSAADDLVVFSARALRSFNGTKTNVSLEELKEICKIAHERNVSVELAANGPMGLCDPDFGTSTRMQYLNYVRRGIDCGVDSVIVGDLGNLLWLKERGVNIPFTASVHLGTFNRYQLAMLEELGVRSAVLPHHVTLEEITRMAASSSLKIIVFGHLGCSFIECACTLLHESSEKVNFGIPCRARWNLIETGEDFAITNMAEDCSICSLGSLMQAGVHSIKIIGRELNSKLISDLTSTYSWAISQFEKGSTPEQVMQLLFARNSWWQNAFCSTKKCKYIKTTHYM